MGHPFSASSAVLAPGPPLSTAPRAGETNRSKRSLTFDELLAKIATEPDRGSEQVVRIPRPDLIKLPEGGVQLPYVPSAPCRTERRKGHRLGPPASVDEIARWQAAWPRHPLPDDLVALLRRANGIHLWADLDEGRAYEGLAPLAEWTLARVRLWGPDAGPTFLDDRYLALSYHADDAAFLVLNVDSARYFQMDVYSADESYPVGEGADALLDWLWPHRIP